ncbi:hypothetical protein IJ096_03255 [Candidatus Saccharibacteria bacterium]|nr:hypothetical protein [Candidatus Saccharibacteria bacterium]
MLGSIVGINEVVLLISFVALYVTCQLLAQAGVKSGPVEGAILCALGAFIIRKASDSFILLMVISIVLSLLTIRLRTDHAIVKAFRPLKVSIWIIALLGVFLGAFPMGLKPKAIQNMAFLILAFLAALANNRLANPSRPLQKPSFLARPKKEPALAPAVPPAKPQSSPSEDKPQRDNDQSPTGSLSQSDGPNGSEKDKKGPEPWLVILAIGLLALFMMVVGWGVMELSLILPRP